ncbi:MAG: response regulator [Bacteroidota bacterium]
MIEQIHQTKDGAFWFLINEGIYRYNGIRAINVSRYLSSTSEYRLNDQQATCFKFDTDENLWLGRRKGLFKINLAQQKIEKITLDKPLRSFNHRNYILQIEEHKDTMYIGTANGLYLVDRKSGTKLKSYLTDGEVPERYRESTKSVKSIYPNLEKDFIWAALMDGLYRIPKKYGNPKRYTIPENWADSLSHNFFKTSLITEKMYFPSWALGMVEFDFDSKEFKQYFTSKKFPKRHDYNTVRTAIPLNDSIALINASRIGNGFFNNNSKKYTWLPTAEEMKQTWATHLYLDRDGFVWSAQTGKIFRSVEPITEVPKAPNSKLDVSAIFADNRLERIPSLSGYDSISLNEYQKNIRLEFTVTKPHIYDTIRYEYKLGNNSWKPIKTKNLLDLELGIGNNPIHLRAKSNTDGIIAKNQFDIAIVVPFYKTPLFLVLVGISLILLTSLLVNYRNKKSMVEKLEELDSMKSRFFSNISHEFRTPLTIMATPLQRRLNQSNINPKDKKEFELILKSNQRLTHLVEQLLELSKLESGKARLTISKLQASAFLSALVEPYQYQAENKGVDFVFVNQLSQETIWSDGEALSKIVANLLSNAVKYTPEGGEIRCIAKRTKNTLQLRIENTGAILSKEEQNQVFNRFYQTHDNNHGVGIGLALVKELVELHRGIIHIDNNYVNGTAFELGLPIAKSQFKASELADSQMTVPKPMNPAAEIHIESDAPEESEKPLALLVEDNADLRTVLMESLQTDYEIAVAKNGEQGLKKALAQIPDIIISDIMMPKKNGVEMTQELKTNELTSHVPIILLTAKAGDENELKGIQSGADDYITKPFKNVLLKSKMENLLQIRNKMRSRYSQEVILKPKDIAITAPDEFLLERIQSVLDEYLVKSSFSTEDFAAALGFSRMQLHRKLKALTGLSTTEFIRSQRLKLAAKILENSDANISEVCYQIGFNNLSYFAKCFKEAYGVSPSQYPKKD